MRAAWKDSLRQVVNHVFYEKQEFGHYFTHTTVREDSGITFHDGYIERNDNVMTQTTGQNTAKNQSQKIAKNIRENTVFKIAFNAANNARQSTGQNAVSDLSSNSGSNPVKNVVMKTNTNTRAGKGMKRLFLGQFKKTRQVQVRQAKGLKLQTMSLVCLMVFCLAAITSVTFAQQQLGQNNQVGQLGQSNAVTDLRLDRYSTIVDILEESFAEFTARPERSRERLALAKETFDLIRQGSSGGLIQGLDNTFARADTAITNESIADFEIQTGLILGGLQRFLYETASREAQDGNVVLAQAYIKRVIEDLNILEGDKIRLSEAVDAGALQAALEIAAGQSIGTHLDSASVALAEENHESAYVSLANAYSGFITVQDSLSMPQSVAQSLLTAIQDVVAKKPDAALNIQALQQDMGSYIQFNESVLQQFNNDLVGQTTAQITGQQTGQIAGQTTGQATGQAAVNQPGSIQNAVAQELAQSGQAGLQGLQSLEGSQANAETALETVRTPLGEVTNQLGAAGQEVETAVQGVTLGAPSLANNAANNVATNVTGAASTIGLNNPASGNAGLGNTGLGLNTPAGQQTGLNQQIGLNQPRVNSAATAVRSNVRTPVQAPVAEATFLEGLWNGLPKAIVMLLLGILSFIPLYLLQLAFGSGNSHWHWVRLAVFLLLFPIMFEGVAALGAALANITGVSALGALTPYTVSGGVIGQMIFALTSLIAIGSLCFGLWGICKQFGLVGQGSAEEDAGIHEDSDLDLHASEEFQTNPSAMTERFTLEDGPAGTVMDMGNETVIEWEEEF